jgi:hypothetical protein
MKRRGGVHWSATAILLAVLLVGPTSAIDLPDISSIPQDLTTPVVTQGTASAGLRVRETTAGWDSTSVYHVIYLPMNWAADRTYPVLVEYGGNGGYRNAFGDACDGTPDGCNLGYGLSGGLDYIWICLPFIEAKEGKKANALRWWGDPVETVRYCLATVRHVRTAYGGDEKRIILCGFSRGAIACNYIGLRDSTIASVWSGFLCHSHYDGVLRWPYPDSDGESARKRLQRLAGRPQFVSTEGSIEATRHFIEASGVHAPFTYVEMRFRNHTDTWALRDCDLRRAARTWLREATTVVKEGE